MVSSFTRRWMLATGMQVSLPVQICPRKQVCCSAETSHFGCTNGKGILADDRMLKRSSLSRRNIVKRSGVVMVIL